MLALAIALAAATPVAEAERDFAARAARDGQWTAFRATATPDAVMFVPQKVVALDWLKGRADPKRAVAWVPEVTATSCDGGLAASMGPYRSARGDTGKFATLWRRQADGGWRWQLDQGGPAASAPALEAVQLRALTASCAGIAAVKAMDVAAMNAAVGDPAGAVDAALLLSGASADATLQWAVRGDDKGHRRMVVWLWDGTRLAEVMRQDTP